jgi:hypothetical protein
MVACEVVPVPLRLIASGEPGALLLIETLPVALVDAVGANVTVKLVVAPGVRLAGALHPISVKPVPVMLCAEIATFAVPVLVRVTGTEALAPSSTGPKLMLAGVADSPPWVPVPLKVIVRVGFVALEVITMLPLAAPAVVGANVPVTVALAPAAICCPALSPLAPNPVPLAVTVPIVTVAFPEFVKVNDCWLDWPTATLLKLKLPGLEPSELPLATALPVRASVWGDPVALSVKRMLPVEPLVDVGANVTLN